MVSVEQSFIDALTATLYVRIADIAEGCPQPIEGKTPMTDTTDNIDVQEQLTRIVRMNAETRKYVEEAIKLSAEARKLNRDVSVAPFTIIFGALTAGAALFGAGAAFIKILGH